MKLTELKKKSILILGLAREGLSTLQFLSQHLPGQRFAVADKQQKIELPGNIARTYFGDDYLTGLKEYEVIIKSPGIPNLKELVEAKRAGKLITSSTQIFFDNFKGQIIGVTGTKGKSTTASLIHSVLKSGGLDVYLMGNIGIASLDLLDSTNSNSVVIYELSSFQLEDLQTSPHIAVFTNIYPEHIDRHINFEKYLKAKSNIFHFQTEGDYLIYNSDAADLEGYIKNAAAKKIPYSKRDVHTLEELISRNEVPLLGEFNLVNILPAVIIGRLYGVTEEKIAKGIKDFQPLPHRLEFITEKRGIKFYNDSLATNPHATIAAISAFGDDLQTLIVGGFDRGVDYSVLGPAIFNSNIKNLILFPTTGEKVWQALASHSSSGNTKLNISKFDANGMEEAVKIAFEVTEPGKIALLSPAASSFNMFKNYEDRGNQFKKFVLE